MTNDQYWDFKYIKRRLIKKKKSFEKKKGFGVGELIITLFALFLIFCTGTIFYKLLFTFEYSPQVVKDTKKPVEERVLGEKIQDWQNYQNDVYHFQVKIPPDAKKTDLGSGAKFQLNDNVVVLVFAEESRGEITINEYLNYQRGKTAEGKAKLIDTKYDNLIGSTALNEIWQYYDQQLKIELEQKRIVTLRNNIFYNLAFIAPLKKFEEMEGDFDYITQSFRIN